MLNVNNKDTRTMSLPSFWYLYIVHFERIPRTFFQCFCYLQTGKCLLGLFWNFVLIFSSQISLQYCRKVRNSNAWPRFPLHIFTRDLDFSEREILKSGGESLFFYEGGGKGGFKKLRKGINFLGWDPP